MTSTQSRHVRLATSWRDARATAGDVPPLGRETVALADAGGRVLADDARALTALPAFASSAMDGWAVRGNGPWRLVGTVLAGATRRAPLRDGEAVVIATGAQVPEGTTGVLRSEDGVEVDGAVMGQVRAGADIRPSGEESHRGEVLVTAGTRLRPPHLGLLAAAGHDTCAVRRRPRVAVLLLGDELVHAGPARDGRVRDALGPQLPGWILSLGGECTGVAAVPDDAPALAAALAEADADVVLTTGSTAAGPVDHLHRALEAAGATLLVDSVDVRPGHPMLLARLPDRRHVVGLPGNPFAAVAAVLTLAGPLLSGLLGRPPTALASVVLAADCAGPRHGDRLAPARLVDGAAEPLARTGSAMLRGLAEADGLLVLPAGASAAGARVEWLPLPV